ncbi:hypothetical protein THIOKS1860029 [Thiocapsa sp. KS1]|nr:hypothetical protein THIOKS1860029 [Thiocapsa sp. KS1]
MDLFRAMNTMSIHNQEDRPLHPGHHTPEKVAEGRGRRGAFVHHEAQVALGADRGEHVDREARPGARHDRRPALLAPCGAAMIIGPNAGLVTEQNERVACLGFALNRRKVGVAPALHEDWILLDRPAQRALRSEPQTMQDAPDRNGTEAHAELASHQFADHLQRPQGEWKLELERVLLANHRRQARQLPPVEFRRAARLRPGFERIIAAVMIFRQPRIDGSRIDIERFRQDFRTGAIFDEMDDPQAKCFFARTRHLTAVGFTLASHVSYYSRTWLYLL